MKIIDFQLKFKLICLIIIVNKFRSPGTRSWASRAAVNNAQAFPGLKVAETCSSQLLQSSSTPNSWAKPSISNIPLSCSMICGMLKLSSFSILYQNFVQVYHPI